MKVNRHHLTTVDSTNTWAKRNANTFDSDSLTLVTADYQTAGRGRAKRIWVSPAGQNIYATFCFFLPKLRQDVANLSQVLSLSATRILEKYHLNPLIHWPNDLLIGNKKIGGILSETTPVNGMYCVILGIGLNVNMTEEEIQKIDRPATSIMLETNVSYPIEEVLKSLQDQFSKDLSDFLKEGFQPFFKQFVRQLNIKSGKKLKINDFHQVWEGVFHSINPDGSINVLLPLNEIRTFLAGEIL